MVQVRTAVQNRTTASLLKMFRIDDCAISSRRAKALQNLVQEFHWDGKEVIFDDHEDAGDSALSSVSSNFTLNSSGSGSDLDLESIY